MPPGAFMELFCPLRAGAAGAAWVPLLILPVVRFSKLHRSGAKR